MNRFQGAIVTEVVRIAPRRHRSTPVGGTPEGRAHCLEHPVALPDLRPRRTASAATSPYRWRFILNALSPVGLRQGGNLGIRDVWIDDRRAAETIVGGREGR